MNSQQQQGAHSLVQLQQLSWRNIEIQSALFRLHLKHTATNAEHFPLFTQESETSHSGTSHSAHRSLGPLILLCGFWAVVLVPLQGFCE